MPCYIKFWGTRGSIPTPASWTRVYGGNTSCVEIRFDDTVLICDAGSGLRELGKDLTSRGANASELHLFITHTHWDHIQGFPFFVPAYSKADVIHVYDGSADENRPFRLLSGQMTSEYFPVAFSELGARIVPEAMNGSGCSIQGVTVRAVGLDHPGGCNAFIFEKEGRKIVYATDNELRIQAEDVFPDTYHRGPLRKVPKALIEAFKGADLLIADAQFDDEQYKSRIGWGHSSCLSTTDLAIQAEVKNLALFHHDPESTDREIDTKVELCSGRAKRHKAALRIFAAREGVELKF